MDDFLPSPGARGPDRARGDSGAFDELPADLAELLADPALWSEPGPGLGDRVVQAITAQSAQLSPEPIGPQPTAPAASAAVSSLAQARSARAQRWVPLSAAACVAALAVGVGIGLGVGGTSGSSPDLTMALSAQNVPGAAASAELTRTDSGWHIELDATGLSPIDGTGTYYQAWLKDDAGVLVPIGTFDEAGPIDLWAGVSPLDFPTMTVTLEATDGDQASSGNRVLLGRLAEAGPAPAPPPAAAPAPAPVSESAPASSAPSTEPTPVAAASPPPTPAPPATAAP
ncbi:MAG: anti-sigma factor [Sporichthyaceae bacterium]